MVEIKGLKTKMVKTRKKIKQKIELQNVTANPVMPSSYPRWASLDIKNEVSDEFNVYEPSEQKKDLGWDYNEVPPRQWFNWLFRRINDWIVYFDYYLHRPRTYTKAALPPAADSLALMVFVSDVGGGVLAYSDGINWKKVTNGGNV